MLPFGLFFSDFGPDPDFFEEIGPEMVWSGFTPKSQDFKGISRMFNEVLFCDFVVALISSQLPEQEEDLFGKISGLNF